MIAFHALAKFSVTPVTKTVVCHPTAGTSLDAVRQLLVAQVVPLLLSHERRLVLHASAVETGAGTIAFIGPSGRGKSTLAAAFAERGHPVVADDCLLIDVNEDRCAARPIDLGLRLRRGSGKRRMTAASLGFTVAKRRSSLHAIYLLDPRVAGLPAIERRTARAAVLELLPSSFQLGMDDPRQTRAIFNLLTAVASRVPVRRLSYPYGFSRLDAAVEHVLDDAR
jgi:serine kinase of HPr protein (carbohydrate metabolism regulator)